MATRAEVARTDNSKLGRAVLNHRGGQSKVKSAPAPVAIVKPAKKKTTKKTTKKSSSKD